MAKGIDYGQLGLLCSSGAIRIPAGTPPYINDIETILLAYLNHLEDTGVYVKDVLAEWGTPRQHWDWFNTARQKLRARPTTEETP